MAAAEPMTACVLSAEDLSVELGGLPVLRGISTRLRAGEAMALLGGNGSGKSTLVRALLGLVPHQRGRIELFGTPLRRFRRWDRVGYVPQRSAAGLAGAKVSEVVGFGRLARRRPFAPLTAADRAAVRAALLATDIFDLAGEEMSRLSGGQQQRVLVARALAGEPDLLVLDEPMAGVDLAHQDAIAAALAARLAAGTTLVIVLHELGALERLVDRAVVLREGRVVHEGPLGPATRASHGGHEHEQANPPRSLPLDGPWPVRRLGP